MKYEVKNVKTFQGMEGQGFNANLYRDGKKVCFIIDDANGGCYHYQWVDIEAPKINTTIIGWEGKPIKVRLTPEEKLLHDFVDKLPPVKSKYFPDGLRVSFDMFLGDLVDDYQQKQQFKRWHKKYFLFQIGKDIGTDNIQTIIKKDGITKEKVIAYIEKKYPKQEYKIIEEGEN